MNQAVIIVGVGELGSVFARGFLRLGYPVYPVTRKISIHDAILSGITIFPIFGFLLAVPVVLVSLYFFRAHSNRSCQIGE